MQDGERAAGMAKELLGMVLVTEEAGNASPASLFPYLFVRTHFPATNMCCLYWSRRLSGNKSTLKSCKTLTARGIGVGAACPDAGRSHAVCPAGGPNSICALIGALRQGVLLVDC